MMINVVYTWVDGDAPGFRELLNQALRDTGASPLSDAEFADRFSDNGGLKYSLRSLEKYAPWVRYVHLVTNGHMPSWMAPDTSRIRLVDHGQLFSSSELPTFNSRAIEWNMHRIPGLSDRFLYLNDDIILVKPIPLDYFYTEEKGFRFWVDAHLTFDDLAERRSTGADELRTYTNKLAALNHVRRILDRTFGPKPRPMPIPSPVFFDKDVFRLVLDQWPDEIRRTVGHKLRTDDDLVVFAAYTYFVMECGTFTFEVTPVDLSKALWGFANLHKSARHREHLEQFLSGFLPTPSSFERVGNG